MTNRMLKLDNTEESQTFAITSRTSITEPLDVIIQYIEEGTEEATIVSAVLTKAGYYTSVDATFTGLNEDSVYTYKINEGANQLHKGEFFVSSQDTVSYKINDNNYVKNTTTNDYIIFE